MRKKDLGFNIVVIGILLLLMTSCRKDPDFDRGVKTFMATLFFLFSMVISGIPAIVFSAINIKSEKSSINVLAIVFTAVFGLFSLLSLNMYINLWAHSTSDWLTLLCFIQYGTLITCVVLFIVKSSSKSIAGSGEKKVSASTQKPIREEDLDYLDKFLDDDLEEG